MRRSLLWFALPLLGLAPVAADAQASGLELRGVVFSVEDGQADRRYLANVLVTASISGPRARRTTRAASASGCPPGCFLART